MKVEVVVLALARANALAEWEVWVDALAASFVASQAALLDSVLPDS